MFEFYVTIENGKLRFTRLDYNSDDSENDSTIRMTLPTQREWEETNAFKKGVFVGRVATLLSSIGFNGNCELVSSSSIDFPESADTDLNCETLNCILEDIVRECLLWYSGD